MPLVLDFHELRTLAQEQGLSLVGALNDISLESEKSALESWQKRGFAGEMRYMERDSSLLTDPSHLLPSVKSIVSFAVRYEQERHPPRAQGFARVARYAWGKDYHLILRTRLELLAEKLRVMGIESRSFTDAVPLLERPLAAKAGMGFVGRHSLLIIPKVGSFILLGELLIDCTITNTPQEPKSSNCGTCVQCRTTCPTQAIVDDFVVDARRCISYLTIEKKGLLTSEERAMIGEWIFGCDECQEICPFNHAVIKIGNKPDIAEFGKEYGAGALINLSELFATRDDGAFKKRFKDTPLARPKREGLIRNGLCVAVNTGAECLLDPIEMCISDSSPIVRATAIWAFSQFMKTGVIKANVYERARDKLLRDPDELVQKEVESLG